VNAMITQTRAIPIRRLRVGDGRWVSIRPIERIDASGLSDFYAELSAESLRRRFLGSAFSLDSRLMTAFAEPEGQGLVGILSERGPDDGEIVAHASVQADGRGGAEVAFAVADALQRHGLGRFLMETVVDQARRRGLRQVTATLLVDNAPMRRVLLEAGCEIVSDDLDDGVEEITLGLAAA
jgi:GNAT superfamily N-acetyltransferase